MAGVTNGQAQAAPNGHTTHNISPKIILYTNHGCPYAHRAHIALEELGLSFEEVIIDLNTPRPQWYLDINPRGLVPSIKYSVPGIMDEEIITESAIVSQFLGQGSTSSSTPGIAELDYAQKLPPRVTDDYVLFFGFDGPEPECCLQQWFPSPFTEKDHKTGIENQFHTSEQYMMYHKALLMGDKDVASQILKCESLAEAKSLGRKVSNFNQQIWDDNCDRVVEEGNFLKFSQNKAYGKR